MAVTGTLGDQPITLNNAAEEATLERLVEIFDKKFADNSGVKKQEAKAIEDNVKANKSYNDIVQSTSRGLGQFEENVVSIGSVMDNTAANLKAAGATLSSSFKQIDADGQGMGSALTSIAGPAASSIGKMGTAGKIAGGALNALAFVAGLAMGVFDSTAKTFYDLTKSGATFGGDMIAMRNAASASGSTLEDFGKAVGGNIKGLSSFSGGSTNGAMALTNLTREARNNQRELTRLGISYRDTPEFLAGFVGDLSNAGFSLQSFGGDFGRVAKVAVTYRKDLQALSEITGKNLADQEAESKKLATDSAFQSVLADMNVEQAASMKALMASMSPLEQQMLKEQMVLGTFGSETAAAAATMPGVAGRVTDVANALARGESDMVAVYANSSTARNAQLAEDAATAREYAKMGVYTNNTLTKIGDENAIFLSRQAEQNAAAAGNLDEVRKQQAIQQELTDNITQREEAMQQIRVAFQTLGTALIDSGIVGVIVGGMEILADTITGISSLIGDNVISALVIGIGGLFAASAAVGAVKSGVGAITSKLTAGLFGGGGAGGGKGGGILGGLLKGAAGGLKAFSNPQILIGAGVLAGTILLIGGAIAGATWLMGAALPKLSEGLKTFADLDGQALADTAYGMLMLSGAMAAFGAGTAVAGLGSLVGGITGSIGKLFGAEDPMEKLLRFASYDIDVVRVENNAKALVAYSKAMSAFGSSQAAEGLGTLVSGISKGIMSLFGGGGDDPLAKVQEFSNIQLDADALSEKATAVSDMMNVFSSIGTLADTDFSYIDNMTDAIYRLADAVDDLNTRKIEALAEFGSASVGTTPTGGTAGAATAAGGAAGVSMSTAMLEEMSAKQIQLLTRLTDAYESNSSEGNDLIRRMASDF